MVPMLVTSATLKSLEDTLSPVELSPAKNLEPTLVNPTLCLNVLHQVSHPLVTPRHSHKLSVCVCVFIYIIMQEMC